MTDTGPDLESLLAFRRPCLVDFWLDPVSPATALLLPHLDLDGLAHDGQPWRFRGHSLVGLRLLPEPGDDVSALVSRSLLALRAWAVHREGDDDIVPMDYDLPWSFLAAVQRDLAAVRQFGLPHLVALAGREGDWLGDWLAEFWDDPAVHEELGREVESAHALGVTQAPCVVVGHQRFEAETMPDDLHDRVAAALDG